MQAAPAAQPPPSHSRSLALLVVSPLTSRGVCITHLGRKPVVSTLFRKAGSRSMNWPAKLDTLRATAAVVHSDFIMSRYCYPGGVKVLGGFHQSADATRGRAEKGAKTELCRVFGKRRCRCLFLCPRLSDCLSVWFWSVHLLLLLLLLLPPPCMRIIDMPDIQIHSRRTNHPIRIKSNII